MPVIQVSLLAGRAAPVKRALIAELTDAAVRTLAVQPEQVRVLLCELPAESWGVGGVPKECPPESDASAGGGA
jgi:4-oxalocrotonate tautomerase